MMRRRMMKGDIMKKIPTKDILFLTLRLKILYKYVNIISNRKKGMKNREIYIEPATFQEKSVHFTIELAFLEIKEVNLYLD